MLWSEQNKPKVTINQMVNRIMTSGKLNRQEHLQLTSSILSGKQITDEERSKINQIFDLIKMGKINLIYDN
ncbi:conserved hypothetical protein [Trichodesmium erythraeum IMS101]|uniref:Uncharacterized protein n=1 Tax=Trichodesmium erythraeum (strain IMS101) TaxID=203124 RepID=Q10Y42_TRIEI|nr:hypothetical protein [Trichodesmium erythraeum GBRTRLIN201]MCH2048266.1 hypothetical protein [Trichodesmium sp. ALOHA_ZT_67]MDE5096083.1 hypothetical protein [Trichodesmium sp. St11_bin5]MDT9340782.1 hypothetical protein [Trichodesmium erythraeum 21-75]